MSTKLLEVGRNKKRSKTGSKKIITIYENNNSTRGVADVLKSNMRQRLTKHSKANISKRMFLSNKDLIGIQHNTKELTRIMNMSGHEHFKEVRMLDKKLSMNEAQMRPQTTQ